jgi:hypothetical protein
MSNVLPFVARKVRPSQAPSAQPRYSHEAPTLRILFRSEEGTLERLSVSSTHSLHTRLQERAVRQAHSDAVARALAVLGAELVEISYLSMSRYEADEPRKVAL